MTGNPGGSFRLINSLSFRNFARGTKASSSLFKSANVNGNSWDYEKTNNQKWRVLSLLNKKKRSFCLFYQKNIQEIFFLTDVQWFKSFKKLSSLLALHSILLYSSKLPTEILTKKRCVNYFFPFVRYLNWFANNFI